MRAGGLGEGWDDYIARRGGGGGRKGWEGLTGSRLVNWGQER